MKPRHRNRRILNVSVGALVLGVGLVLLASALGSYRQYYYTPSRVVSADFVAESDVFRVGGLVIPGTIQRGEGANVRFALKDFEGEGPERLDVTYSGVLPDLFKEDSGAVVVGRLQGDQFMATELLAKHDENYRPKID